MNTLEVRYVRREDGARTAYGVMGSGPVLIVPPGGVTHLEWYTADTAAHETFCARLAEQWLDPPDRHTGVQSLGRYTEKTGG